MTGTMKANFFRALASLLAAITPLAEAAFPGKDGRIAFASDRTTGSGVM